MEVWKIKRELTRAKRQLMCLPELLTEPAQIRKHNAAFKANFPLHEGAISLGDRVALYLIYQPGEIAESVLETCRYLVQKGYSPLVVSNTRLDQAALDKLSPTAWRILERPNFGYDFGGYRDGILSLKDWGVSPKYLCILNDSIWFPLYGSESLIDFGETNSDAISGGILRDVDARSFLESYFYIIPGSIFADAVFERFWEEFPLTSNKYKVIRRGEKGFSRSMNKAGFEIKPAYPNEEFMRRLALESDEFLKMTLEYSTFPDARLQKSRSALLADWHKGKRDETLGFINAILPKRMSYSAFPYAMTMLHDYPFLKKSGNPVAILWRSAMLTAWNAGDLPAPSKVVRNEVEQSLSQ